MSNVKYFVTHGQGLEPFVLKELTEKLKTQIVININEKENFTGKILFSAESIETDTELPAGTTTPLSITQLLQSNLKTVERLFGFVYSDVNADSILLSPNDNTNSSSLSNLYNLIVKIAPFISTILEQFAEIQMGITEKNGVESQGEEEVSSKRRKKSIYSFRVDVKITGKYRRLLNTYQSSKSIGAALLKNLTSTKSGEGWQVDLRNPQMTINVYVTDDGLLCGIPFIQQSIQTQNRSYSHPLSDRDYLNTSPVRSTLAYVLSSLVIADESKENGRLLILDPMCGSAVILIELVKNFPQVSMAYGMDNNTSQIEHAVKNIEQAKVATSISIIQSDSTELSLLFHQNIVFDGVVCDLPFGLQHGTYDSVVKTLPLIFLNIEKVVKAGGNIVLLISLTMGTVMENLIQQQDLTWTLIQKYPVKLGVLQAVIYHYKKPSVL